MLYSVCTLFENAKVNRDIEQKEKVVERKFINFERTVQIETQPVRVLLDSGASINILNYKTFEKINKHLRKPLILKKTKTKVTTYGNFEPNLKIKGEVHVLVETKTKFINTNFYVVDTKHKNILSGVTSIALNLISLHKTKNVCVLSDYNQSEAKNKPIKTVYAEAVNQKLPPESKRKETHFNNNIPKRIKPLIKEFKNSVFSGKIGKLKNHQVSFHVDQNVTPVAQRERRIPFALREKVNKEINKLEEQGIIEDVTNEATDWINPVVIVPKSDNEIRLCIDMREANKAIKRTRYPTPTVEDILAKVKGAKLFTKLDLKSAFHQIELTPESRKMTTFQSETRIKRYTRLMFGANSASEELQHALRNVLSGINGTTNIHDDILIYAGDTIEHDKILTDVLQRLHENGLTLNLNKKPNRLEKSRFPSNFK